MSRYARRICTHTGDAYYLHRAIAEWAIGRPLKPGEVVHHISGNEHDNHPDNLIVCSSQRAHMLLHHFERRCARGVVPLFPLSAYLAAHGEVVRCCSLSTAL